MHPEKSGVVYCKDSNRRGNFPRIQFTFLGFTFRPRRAQARDGKFWTSFLPAVSAAAMKRMHQSIREWHIPRQTSVGLHELATHYNPTLRGWLNYYGRFYPSALRESSSTSMEDCCSGRVANIANSIAMCDDATAGGIRRCAEILGCSLTGWLLDDSRYERWKL